MKQYNPNFEWFLSHIIDVLFFIVQEEDDADDADDADEEDEPEAEKSGLEALVAGSEEKFSDVIEMAAKFQPTGNTLVRLESYFLLR